MSEEIKMSDKTGGEDFDGYYVVARDPQEIRNMIEWAKFRVQNTAGNRLHQVWLQGILHALNYLLDPEAPRPDEYRGPFSLENILKGTRDPEILEQHCFACVHKARDEKIAKMFKNANP